MYVVSKLSDGWYGVYATINRFAPTKKVHILTARFKLESDAALWCDVSNRMVSNDSCKIVRK